MGNMSHLIRRKSLLPNNHINGGSKLLVLDPYEISNPKLNNQHISRFCLLKMGLFRLWRATKIKPRHIESYIFFFVIVTIKLELA